MTRAAAPVIALAAGALLFAAVACGGDAEPGLPPLPPPATVTPRALSSEAAPAAAILSPAAGSPSPSSTLTPAADASATSAPATDAPAAAATVLNARVVSPLTADACRRDNPAGQPCIELTSAPDTVARGIAVFRGGYPDGGPFTLVMAHATGGWRYWYTTQQPLYHLLALPGEVIACADPAQLAAGPAGAATRSVAAGTRLAVDRLELVKPGELNASRGDAWYHVATPAEGWVRASDVTDAALGDCRRRNDIERDRPRG